MTRCSGGDGGDDGGDDGDDDPNEVQLDDDDDGVDFPLREGISPTDSCPPESSFLSGVSRPAEAAVSLRDYCLELRFSGRRSTRKRGGRRGLWAPLPTRRRGQGRARAGLWGAHGGPPRLLLLAGLFFWKNKIFGVISINC